MAIKIGPLTLGRPALVHVIPELGPKPEPEQVSFSGDTTFDDYVAVAKQAGFSNGAMLQAQILRFLQREEMVTYNTERVARYMDSLVARERSLNPKSEERLLWCWRPLREQDKGALVSHTDFWENGAIDQGQYNLPVPMSALQIVAKIAAEFPDVHFYVSDYTSNQPDPFLAVTASGMHFIVVDVWDEPGFRATR